ncbi:MAG: complex I NDUFA9 subunit family protein [Phenylobacterium sp.]|jgi:NADH dehydrogenase|uniref:complex I NDUFA9 subunit family protein n=1 Tax=Phenylobacterium sp. TaxID=1871053 RepID=UPI002A3640FE|nr:complex I NDUFA9 subunit family protein [Phenylobacterium sp.]MDX9997872.1 complex I NDUFA9 subunit family protein [Phenylobacterium sp.]
MQDLVTVVGGSGFIGSQVVRALARKGLRLRIAVRRPHLAGDLRVHGEVGQIDLVQANIRNPASLAEAMDGAAACVNLVAVAYEHGRQKFQSLHVMGARNAADAARKAGVSRFVQVSALGADADSPAKFARTKAEGEAAAREIYPDAVVVRPSVVFGPEDNFFNRFAQMATISPVLPLVGGGKTRFQPVFVGDVARAVAETVVRTEVAGRTYELGGPAVYTFRELMELMLAEIQRKRLLLPIPFPAAALLGAVGDLVAATPVPPPITSDQVKLLKADNVVSPGAPGLAELGITPTTLEAVIPTYLYRYRRGGQYAELAQVA